MNKTRRIEREIDRNKKETSKQRYQENKREKRNKKIK